ncbi:hypothetical protein K8R32_04530 [bacterium]|nr:hypothetical protein [bacterium]
MSFIQKIISKRKLVKRDALNLAHHYRKRYKRVLIFLFYALTLVFFSFFFIGTKFFYPLHFVIAIVLLAFAGKLFKDGVLTYRKKFHTTNLVYRFYEKYGIYVFALTLIFFLLSVWFIVRPPLTNPFKGMAKESARQLIENDIASALMLVDRMETCGYELVGNPIFFKEEFSADEREQLKSDWDRLVGVLGEAERLSEIHRYFSRLPFSVFSREAARSFIISYSLYVKKYEIFHRLMTQVGSNEYAKKIFDERVDMLGSGEHYTKITRYYFQPKTIIKLNMGRIYLGVLNMFGNEEKFGEVYTILRNKAERSHDYIAENIDRTLLNALLVGKDKFEKGMFDTWFPLQKTTASLMGNLYISNRKEKFITLEQIKEMKKYLMPGDILVERRNWFASNIGIPGFWPHVVLYLGTLNEADLYFKDLFPYKSYESFRILVKEEYPQAFLAYKDTDKDGFQYAVIEAKAEGVLFHTLEESTDADYVGAMRPRLEKEDIMLAILRAIANYDKPFDYDFDFETRDEFVCSELVYDAYLSFNGKKGLDFKLDEMAGRKYISPTNMVKKLYDERNETARQLDFVYFLDGNETLEKAFVKNEAEFITTWTRAKYDWSQE